MHMPKFTSSPMPGRKAQPGHDGIIYTQASDFVHPAEIDKQRISTPTSAKPMGIVDVTANDWVYTGGEPSREELHTIKKHTRQTAHVLGAGLRKRVSEALGQTTQ
ncbi:hypothetical protein IWW38_002258 [Coemansia aciculifera]|uniref:Uncharacterized protein n=1 Tax=Coemansia aciculifera TaxID=417176 RepID=A0ACC1M3R4_9FUNG|nr:hypothetical protein IWW38_002258 [Coemansia aciculifera]